MQTEINLIFPHQLFQDSPLLSNGHDFVMIEEFLFFKQYKFHKQKIAFHRASMMAYKDFLQKKGFAVKYISSFQEESDIRIFLKKNQNIRTIHVIDPTDNWLEKRLTKLTKDIHIALYESPLFINKKEDNNQFFKAEKTFFFQANFYKLQRKRLAILMKEGKPVGDKWSFDAENRKKYPKNRIPPAITFSKPNPYYTEAISYVKKYFSDHYGELSETPIYPIDFESAEQWFQQFLIYRFHDFGAYEDAIVKEHAYLHHSMLSPLMNVGLIQADYIVDKAIDYAGKHNIPLNSLEGFVRQIIGWREFIRGMYELKGRYSRTRNFYSFSRKIPQSFYTGETGIEPLDHVIKQVIKTGYCHHIERLMVLGSFMLLCEFDPDEVYKWFMELFIDAYDWVMVPNVYGMSQFADGGLFATKPYISGSNYIKKMSNYKNGEWQKVWDGLFWRFMHVHRKSFSKNPRLSMLLSTFDRMSDEKRKSHMEHAERYLKQLD